ncbi:GspH/FimT family pseudopilin [Pseudomonas sp. R5(2019)]|uniref:GspH/FimT family pseudopilin n=1 Tax=Pseudomonas sp. R5(2019) TaxID=2697566 RepID=UPI0014128617|nr:GspH/FimT family pseudopilin [Pseudomonas sp. R5(2019)]NBA96439.1 prepilin-type N-terminal cleavage/methylation domain-containing protein [Pseudomonas sp. R5(2019)]
MRQNGITLIELLSALALIAILVHLSAPAFRKLVESAQRQEMAKQLASGLRMARSEAMVRHERVIVQAIGEDWSNGWRIIVDASGKGHEDVDNPVLLEYGTRSRVPVIGNHHLKVNVQFSSLGEPLGSKGYQLGTLHICAKREPVSHYQVVLAKTGRISLRSNTDEQPLCERRGSKQGANA